MSLMLANYENVWWIIISVEEMSTFNAESQCAWLSTTISDNILGQSEPLPYKFV